MDVYLRVLLVTATGCVAYWWAWQRAARRYRGGAERIAARAIVDAAPGPCGLVDGDMRWVWVNEALSECLATDREDQLGAIAGAQIDAADRDGFAACLHDVIYGNQVTAQLSCDVATSSGAVFPAEVAISVVAGPTPSALVTIHDRSEAQRQMAQLRLTERALHAATCAIVICDATIEDLPMVYVNAAFELLTGYSAAEVLGKNCRLLNEREREQPGLAEVRAAIRERRDCTVVLRNYRKDGSVFWNELTICPVMDAAGQVTHLLGMQDDVTERMELSAEHERLLAVSVADQETAARAASARETLLAVVSHELRSPLNAIRLWTSLLQSADGVDSALVARAAEQIETGVATQSRIIEDLLDVSRFESGRLELERKPMNLVALVTRLVTNTAPAVAKHGVTLTLDPVQDAVTVLADAGRIEQVLQNLIDNAVKFTPSGGSITVSIATLEHRVRVVVRDTGQGIATEKLSEVFEQFWQADDRDTRAHGGLGLGLNLVRQIVESHGGTVEAHSDGIGKGAAVSFELAVQATRAQSVVAARPAAVAAERIGGDVLVVDDDATTREALAIGLRMRGFAARVASGVDEALAHVATTRPRVLISDLMMAGQSGFDLVEALREDEFVRDLDRTPAIAITGRGSPADRRAVRFAGFDRYLRKPVRMDELVDALTELLEAPRPSGGHSILCVCASRDGGEQLRVDLARHGHEVQVATSAADALALVHSNVPEVLVAELHLPDGRGESLLDSVHNDNAETLTVLLVDQVEPCDRDAVHARLNSAQLVRSLSRWLTL